MQNREFNRTHRRVQSMRFGFSSRRCKYVAMRKRDFFVTLETHVLGLVRERRSVGFDVSLLLSELSRTRLVV